MNMLIKFSYRGRGEICGTEWVVQMEAVSRFEPTILYYHSHDFFSSLYSGHARSGDKYFSSDYKQFYVKADEPTYIKFTKLQILSYLANE